MLRSVKKTDFVWRYLFNRIPTRNYRFGNRKPLTAAECEIVERLDRDGIAVTTISSLFEDGSRFDELDFAVNKLLGDKKNDIVDLKLGAGNSSTIGVKTFNLEMLGSELMFNAADVFARFALSEPFLNIANAYLRMHALLRYYNVWYTAASSSTARESQLWHFDREDNYILKVFLYLDDVGEGGGPFTYAAGTHRRGKFRSIAPEYFDEGGVKRTTDEQMEKVFPRKEWIRCTGKKWTVIFADTRGFHKGGEARTKDRLMYTCMFTSPASESKQLIHFPSGMDTTDLSKREIGALGLG